MKRQRRVILSFRKPKDLARPHSSRRAGATLIELVFIGLLVCCIVVGVMIGHRWSSARYARVLRGFLGVVGWFVGVFGFALLLDLATGGIPRLPVCRKECCRGPGMWRGHGDYTGDHTTGEWLNICRCGDRYERRGRRFTAIHPDGTRHPYLIWRPFRGWYPDRGISPAERQA